MNIFQIFVKTNDGWALYGKTPLYQQAIAVEFGLKQKGYKVRLRKSGMWLTEGTKEG